MRHVQNINVSELKELASPETIKAAVPLTDGASETVFQARRTIEAILDGRDPRLLVITGPCSIHDPAIARDYAERLQALQSQVEDRLFLVMRVYFEKPRTIGGWKGLINDPHMNGSFEIEEGLQLARRILLDVAATGLPAATEFLDPITPQYIADLVSWAAIGARTTESQTHREMASGLSMPVGFKNSTDGSVDVALNAVESSRRPQCFLGVSQRGSTAVVSTRGNTYGHLVLRGGNSGPNYDRASMAAVAAELQKRKLQIPVVVDCSHANSGKDHNRQIEVMADVVSQIRDAQKLLRGVMLESNIHAGAQSIPADLSQLLYGVSVTDKCLDWERTAKLLLDTAAALR